MSAVLIVGSRQDPQVKRVQRAIRARGGRVSVLDAERFPEHAKCSLDNGVLRIGSKRIARPRSVYLRGMHAHVSVKEFEQDLRVRPKGVLAQIDEKLAFLTSAILTLESQGVPVVNGPWANAQHSNKPYQLALLQGAGLRVPEWTASNDPAHVRQFVSKNKRVVYKPLAGGATVHAVEARDLSTERREALRYAPVLFQKRIDGVSVRAYVVGRNVVGAAELHSTELDYRRGEDAVVPTKLSAEERRMAVAAAKACGMQFAGVDFIRGPRKPYLLESNPSPMFAVFEDKTGLAIADPLAAYLLR